MGGAMLELNWMNSNSHSTILSNLPLISLICSPSFLSTFFPHFCPIPPLKYSIFYSIPSAPSKCHSNPRLNPRFMTNGIKASFLDSFNYWFRSNRYRQQTSISSSSELRIRDRETTRIFSVESQSRFQLVRGWVSTRIWIRAQNWRGEGVEPFRWYDRSLPRS